jgi:hypothetical protein
MRNIDFHDIDEAMLRGAWLVVERALHRADADSPTARAQSLQLAVGELTLQTATELLVGPDRRQGGLSLYTHDGLELELERRTSDR